MLHANPYTRPKHRPSSPRLNTPVGCHSPAKREALRGMTETLGLGVAADANAGDILTLPTRLTPDSPPFIRIKATTSTLRPHPNAGNQQKSCTPHNSQSSTPPSSNVSSYRSIFFTLASEAARSDQPLPPPPPPPPLLAPRLPLPPPPPPLPPFPGRCFAIVDCAVAMRRGMRMRTSVREGWNE